MPKTATIRTLDTYSPDPVADPTDAILDRKALDAIREMESPALPDVLEQIVDVYLEHAPNQLTTLAAAVETSDIKTQHRIAHNLKSSSAKLGAHDLAALCQTLETSTRHGPSKHAGELVAEITGAFAQVRAALLVELGKA